MIKTIKTINLNLFKTIEEEKPQEEMAAFIDEDSYDSDMNQTQKMKLLEEVNMVKKNNKQSFCNIPFMDQLIITTKL